MTDLARSRSLISASLFTSQRNHLYRALAARPWRGVIVAVLDRAGAASAWAGSLALGGVISSLKVVTLSAALATCAQPEP
jgi:hypothetical protein